MPISITANRAATLAQQSLVERNERLAISTERLSSGNRVTSASQDAAAMAVSSGLRTDIASFRQAQTNLAQGQSMAQVADGAMSQISDIVTRLRSLGVQAASSELSATERAMLDEEYQALLLEVDRIAGDTEFNGIPLVSSSTISATDQNDMGADNLITSANGFETFDFANSFGDGAVKLSYDATTYRLTAEDLETGSIQMVTLSTTPIALGTTEVARFGAIGLTVTLNSDFDKTTDIDGADAASIVGGTGVIDDSTISLSNVVLDTNAPFPFGSADDATIAVNAAVPATSSLSVTLNGTTFTDSSLDLSTTGTKTATLTDGAGNSFDMSFNVTTAFDGSEAASIELKELGQVVGAVSTMVASTTFNIQVGSGTDTNDEITFTVASMSVEDLGLSNTDVLTETTARTAISMAEAALVVVSNARSDLGAAQSRMEFASISLSAVIEGNAIALSDLMDVDVGEEITQLTSDQTLMQAAIDMLARANTRSDLLLNLLR